ncbi:DMT family transporter [Shewanella violacea]|uniref:Integral membrane domain protein n=1 Tax=Shewanella violacea (strain JCM 10179 / CIP 106290 / LMG 19151 / DSS12) TaxID=637905 RepID=D4ZEX3_SHEVD|nr:DMT family transporter [Shewanella violacea]BAJ00353.1 integral membrane domain protein [Shewanella violacea DSS12]
MNILLAMIPAFFWGTTYAVTQFSLPDWPPLLLGALRALPAGLILLAMKPNIPKKRDWGILFKLGSINIAAFFSLIFVMALTLPSAISGVGMISVPVFAMLAHWMVSKTQPKTIQAIFGFLLIVLAWLLFDPGSISLNPLGMLAMLGAIICIIVGSSITKALGSRIHWWSVLTWQLILGGGILAIAAGIQALISPEIYIEAFHSFNLTHGLGLLWIVILNTVLGYTMYVWLLQRMTVVDFTFGGIANPIAGITAGMLLLGEVFTPHQYALMACMLLCSLMPQIIGLIGNRSTLNKEQRASSISDKR